MARRGHEAAPIHMRTFETQADAELELMSIDEQLDAWESHQEQARKPN